MRKDDKVENDHLIQVNTRQNIQVERKGFVL